MSTKFKPIFIPRAFLADKMPAEATTDAQKKDNDAFSERETALDKSFAELDRKLDQLRALRDEMNAAIREAVENNETS